MIYVVYFSSLGAPSELLTPAIDTYIKVSDGTSAGVAPTVSELSGGFYKFTATPAEAILCRVDAGVGLADPDRYKVLQITPNDDDLDAPVSVVDTVVDAIKAKTDTLPPKLFVKNLG